MTKKRLAMRKQMDYDSPAALGLEVPLLAAKVRSLNKPFRLGAGFKNGKSSFGQNSATLNFQQRSTLRAFSIAAVLRRNNSAQGGVTARTKAFRRKHGAQCYLPRYTGRENERGYMCGYGVAQNGCRGCRLILSRTEAKCRNRQTER